MHPDCEVAFPAPKTFQPLPSRGILAAAGFSLKIIRQALEMKEATESVILDGLSRLIWAGEAFLAGPVLGAPMAVMALEELARRGAREIVFLGLAGSLKPELKPGQLVCPDSGLSTEGTSAHYPAPLAPDQELRYRIISGGTQGEVLGGRIWSTDGIYRETYRLAERQKSAGARLVDMECTALWAAARFRGLRLASLLVIADVLDGWEHRNAFGRPEFRQGLARAAELAGRLIKSSNRTREEGA
ncbi:MAG: hypothetical protein LBP33_05390 [Candidatus Adiutrix sp.]|jgi:nucleoside phosphorylase|nr:hypothetical protein [Candidatus Adiutrix sp.]